MPLLTFMLPPELTVALLAVPLKLTVRLPPELTSALVRTPPLLITAEPLLSLASSAVPLK